MDIYQCNRCKKDWPASKYSPSQLPRQGRWCQPCHAQWREDKREGRLPRRATDVCLNCGKDITHLRHHAKWCSSACSARGFRTANPERRKEYNLRCLYGMELTEFETLLRSQGGGCAICGDTQPRGSWNVDHCHNTKLVRGILCAPCNLGIGNLKEDPEVLRRAVAYLLRDPTSYIAAHARNTKTQSRYANSTVPTPDEATVTI